MGEATTMAVAAFPAVCNNSRRVRVCVSGCVTGHLGVERVDAVGRSSRPGLFCRDPTTDAPCSSSWRHAWQPGPRGHLFGLGLRWDTGSTGAGRRGTGTDTTVNPSIPVKSFGLHVYKGNPFASAVAAIMTS